MGGIKNFLPIVESFKQKEFSIMNYSKRKLESIQLAYWRAVEIRARELARSDPSECVLIAAEIAIRNLAPFVGQGFSFYAQGKG